MDWIIFSKHPCVSGTRRLNTLQSHMFCQVCIVFDWSRKYGPPRADVRSDLQEYQEKVSVCGMQIKRVCVEEKIDLFEAHAATHTRKHTHSLAGEGGQSQPEGTGHSRLYIITITHAGTKSLHKATHNGLHNQCVSV